MVRQRSAAISRAHYPRDRICADSKLVPRGKSHDTSTRVDTVAKEISSAIDVGDAAILEPFNIVVYSDTNFEPSLGFLRL